MKYVPIINMSHVYLDFQVYKILSMFTRNFPIEFFTLWDWQVVKIADIFPKKTLLKVYLDLCKHSKLFGWVVW